MGATGFRRRLFNDLATGWFHWLGRPCFQVYGKARHEQEWHLIEVHATHRRDQDSLWPSPFFRGTCITWTAAVIAVGWDFAEQVLREQALAPASREQPVQVAGGRLRDAHRRLVGGGRMQVSASEVLAHECGHTGQARKLGFAYWPAGAFFTLFREGSHWWNHFENQASEQGQFGGVVPGSVCPELTRRLGPGGELDHPLD
jgi:hypothetical protein